MEFATLVHPVHAHNPIARSFVHSAKTIPVCGKFLHGTGTRCPFSFCESPGWLLLRMGTKWFCFYIFASAFNQEKIKELSSACIKGVLRCWKGRNLGFLSMKTLNFRIFLGLCSEPHRGLTAPPSPLDPSWFGLAPPATSILDPPVDKAKNGQTASRGVLAVCTLQISDTRWEERLAFGDSGGNDMNTHTDTRVPCWPRRKRVLERLTTLACSVKLVHFCFWNGEKTRRARRAPSLPVRKFGLHVSFPVHLMSSRAQVPDRNSQTNFDRGHRCFVYVLQLRTSNRENQAPSKLRRPTNELRFRLHFFSLPTCSVELLLRQSLKLAISSHCQSFSFELSDLRSWKWVPVRFTVNCHDRRWFASCLRCLCELAKWSNQCLIRARVSSRQNDQKLSGPRTGFLYSTLKRRRKLFYLAPQLDHDIRWHAFVEERRAAICSHTIVAKHLTVQAVFCAWQLENTHTKTGKELWRNVSPSQGLLQSQLENAAAVYERRVVGVVSGILRNHFYHTQWGASKNWR